MNRNNILNVFMWNICLTIPCACCYCRINDRYIINNKPVICLAARNTVCAAVIENRTEKRHYSVKWTYSHFIKTIKYILLLSFISDEVAGTLKMTYLGPVSAMIAVPML